MGVMDTLKRLGRSVVSATADEKSEPEAPRQNTVNKRQNTPDGKKPHDKAPLEGKFTKRQIDRNRESPRAAQRRRQGRGRTRRA